MRLIAFGINQIGKLRVILKRVSECKSHYPKLAQDAKALPVAPQGSPDCRQDRGSQAADCTLTCFPKREVIFGVIHSQDWVVVGS